MHKLTFARKGARQQSPAEALSACARPGGEHKFLCDHVVDGRILMPATSYVVTAWEAAAFVKVRALPWSVVHVLALSLQCEPYLHRHLPVTFAGGDRGSLGCACPMRAGQEDGGPAGDVRGRADPAGGDG